MLCIKVNTFIYLLFLIQIVREELKEKNLSAYEDDSVRWHGTTSFDLSAALMTVRS